MATELTIEYAPLYAAHVKGRYSKAEIDPDTGQRVPQLVEATCEVCGARYKNTCRQGMPRQHISRFAGIHLHRNVFAAKRVPT